MYLRVCTKTMPALRLQMYWTGASYTTNSNFRTSSKNALLQTSSAWWVTLCKSRPLYSNTIQTWSIFTLSFSPILLVATNTQVWISVKCLTFVLDQGFWEVSRDICATNIVNLMKESLLSSRSLLKTLVHRCLINMSTFAEYSWREKIGKMATSTKQRRIFSHKFVRLYSKTTTMNKIVYTWDISCLK